MPAPVKPASYIDWVPSGNPSYIQQPSAGQAATGWTYLESPPMEYMNWLFYTLDQWIQWIEYNATIASKADVSSNTTMALPITIYLCNPTGGAFTMTFPLAGSNDGYVVTLKNVQLGSGNVVHLARSGSDLLEGSTTAPDLQPGDAQTWCADVSGNWYLISP